MTTIYVDNQPYQVTPKQNLLHVCLSLGFNLPYFCWHPALGSVGACRQCAVKQFKDEKDTRGKLVMACMTPAAQGVRISIEDPEAAAFRAAVIEGLMLNHPHDCPVCDEGGECHLQDMTVMTGHDYRRYAYQKRTFRNQYIGPLVNHEMNRCIQCYRCVRFYREYAGGRDLNSFHLHNTVFFGRHEDGVLESEFSGNLVEVCPTGVFTDATLKRHYTRKWDLQMAPSICVHCGLGCNTSPGERYGGLRRILNRYNEDVNGYFLCDRGRFGYEFVNSEKRVREPLLRRDGNLQRITKAEALEHSRKLLSGNGQVIGIGSPRASLESNFALRTLVGPDKFFAGMTDKEWRLTCAMLAILRHSPARSASLLEIELSDAVLLLGEDVTNVAPRMALSLRQSIRQEPMQIAEKLGIPIWNDAAVREAVQDERGPLFIATPDATRLDDIAAETYRGGPDDLARIGFAVAHCLDGGAPAVPDLASEQLSLAGRIAEALRKARRPVVISGPSCNSEAVIQAAANVARALCRNERVAGLGLITPECNSFGLALMGGGSLSDAFQLVDERKADTVIILENDLYRRAPAQLVDAFFEKAKHTVVLDCISTPTTAKVELVIPAATFAEADGTFVSSEGRAQRFFQVFAPGDETPASWRWLREAMIAMGRREADGWENLDGVIAALAEALPALASVSQAAPSAEFRIADAKIARAPHRYSGRTSMLANISVHEPKSPEDPDSPFSFSMEGSPKQPPPGLNPFFWAPGWNSIQSVNKFQTEVGGPLRCGHAGVRLIEPSNSGGGSYFSGVPAAFEARADEWLLVPLYHIFGSEELSRLSPAIAELAPEPYIALHPGDAERLQVQTGDGVKVRVSNTDRALPVKLTPTLPKGVAGVPAGFPWSAGMSFPAWSKLSKA